MTAISLGSVTVEATSPRALASFWAELLGGVVVEETGHVFVSAREPDGFAMFFRPRTGARPERQVQHLDLTVPWGSRAGEVARAIELGATHRWDVLDEHPWVQWSTLADPDGNLFCLAEHPPSRLQPPG
ncbi:MULTISPECIES: VOC family protein [unclassified Modestobacter]